MLVHIQMTSLSAVEGINLDENFFILNYSDKSSLSIMKLISDNHINQRYPPPGTTGVR